MFSSDISIEGLIGYHNFQVIGSVKADDADATSPNNAVHYVSEDDRFRIADNGEVIYAGEGVLSKVCSLLQIGSACIVEYTYDKWGITRKFTQYLGRYVPMSLPSIDALPASK